MTKRTRFDHDTEMEIDEVMDTMTKRQMLAELKADAPERHMLPAWKLAYLLVQQRRDEATCEGEE